MKNIKKYLIEFTKQEKACIIVVTLMLVFSSSSYLAKYASSVGGSSSASVAVWNVSPDTTANASDNLSLVSGNTTASYVIKVRSTSDVSSVYSIVLSNVPTGLEVTLDGGAVHNPVNNTITFDSSNCSNCFFNLGSGVTEHTHTLVFNDPLSTSNSGNNAVTIDVIINQVN